MAIADRLLKTKFAALLSINKTSRFVKSGLLICFALILPVYGQFNKEIKEIKEINQARSEFDNGEFLKAIVTAGNGVEKARKIKSGAAISKGLGIIADSQIVLKKYDEAEATLNEALRYVSGRDSEDDYRKAMIYIRFARLFRSRYKFAEALNYSRKAITTAPKNNEIRAEHFLNIGRILFASGYDVSAVVWLEKAEILLEPEIISNAKIEIFRYLTLAWSSKLKYRTALRYAEKWVESAKEPLQIQIPLRATRIGNRFERLRTSRKNLSHFGKRFETFTRAEGFIAGLSVSKLAASEFSG